MHRKTAKLAFDKIAASGTKKGNLLVLHGLFGSKANFRSLSKRPEMSAHHDVYLLDARNHGDSEHVDSHTIADMAADVERFMDDQGLAKAVLLGHSMGGKTVMQTALNLQDRVEGLIVGDMGPFNYMQLAPSNIPILELMNSLNLRLFGHKDEVHKVFMDHLNGNKMVADFLMTNLMQDKERGLKWRVNVPVLARDYEDISSAIPRKGLTYKGPTTVLYGTKSEYMPTERFPEFKTWFPEIDLERDFKAIQGGHWIHFSDPEAFLKHVKSFLETLH
jgi:esterase